MKKMFSKRGSGVVEIIVALSIITVGIFSLLRAYNYYLRFALSHRYDVRADLLAEEGIEAVKFLRDEGWSTKIAPLTSGVDYDIAFVGGKWTSTTTSNDIDGRFRRRIVLSDVYRGADDRISASGTLDPNTRKVMVEVSFRRNLGTTTKSISTYITNIFAD